MEGVVVLDLFKDWTPEMIGLLVDSLKDRRIGEWERKTSEEKSRINVKRIDSLERFHSSLTPEEEDRRLRNSLLSPEAIARCVEVKANRTEEEERNYCRKISEGFSNMTPKAREEWLRTGSEGKKAFWAKLTPEEKEARLRNSVLSDKAISNSSKALQVKPSTEELVTGGFLGESFPGRYKYTGDRKSGELVRSLGYTGRKHPDFIRLDGIKEVVEVLGGFGIWHFWGDDVKLVKHYAEYGFKCICVWEWDIWTPGELDSIFKEVY